LVGVKRTDGDGRSHILSSTGVSAGHGWHFASRDSAGAFLSACLDCSVLLSSASASVFVCCVGVWWCRRYGVRRYLTVTLLNLCPSPRSHVVVVIRDIHSRRLTGVLPFSLHHYHLPPPTAALTCRIIPFTLNSPGSALVARSLYVRTLAYTLRRRQRRQSHQPPPRHRQRQTPPTTISHHTDRLGPLRFSRPDRLPRLLLDHLLDPLAPCDHL
jgi:hypothetical protein